MDFSKEGTIFIVNSWKFIAIGEITVGYILGTDRYTSASEEYPYAKNAISKVM